MLATYSDKNERLHSAAVIVDQAPDVELASMAGQPHATLLPEVLPAAKILLGYRVHNGLCKAVKHLLGRARWTARQGRGHKVSA